jgi:NADH-quinone oxidoreductase subunit N
VTTLFSPDFMAILPEVLILVLGVLVLILDPFWKEENRRLYLGWLTAGGLMAVLVITVLFDRPGAIVNVWGDMLRYDWLAFSFQIFFIFAAAVTAMFMMDVEKLSRRAEAYSLLLASLIGMNLMAASGDLIMLYLSIETMAIPLYVLSGFMLDDKFSIESGFKYLLFGAMTSAMLLYGFSLLFGVAGTTRIVDLAVNFSSLNPITLGLIIFILIGLIFKISAVPFHFWAPDVYQGAPTPVAGFLSTASKAAGFAVLLRLFLVAFPAIAINWAWILAVVATLTMTLGNFLALTQKNIKRMLAYSSIAHAGYILIGVVATTNLIDPSKTDPLHLGATSVVYYVIAYILTNLAAFGAVVAYGRIVGSDEIKAYSGMSRRSPGLALVMLVSFLSLSGMPPFGGFVAKVFVFASAINQGWIWLAVVGVLNSIVGLYYYLTVLKYVYLYRAANEEEEKMPLPISRPYVIALALLSAGIILLGIYFMPWFNMATKAAIGLYVP